MENDSRPAEEVQAKIKALAEEYETLTGDKMLVRRIKSHRPQEIWAWMNSLAHEYSVITGKKNSIRRRINRFQFACTRSEPRDQG